MTTYQLSPNRSPRQAMYDRRLRDAKLAAIAENQPAPKSTPHDINRLHFLQTEYEFENGILLNIAHVGTPDNVEVTPSAPEPKIKLSKTTTTLRGGRDTKLGNKSKPHGAPLQRGPKLPKPFKVIDNQI